MANLRDVEKKFRQVLEPDPDAPITDWLCSECKVIVPVKERCRHCGKTETDKT